METQRGNSIMYIDILDDLDRDSFMLQITSKVIDQQIVIDCLCVHNEKVRCLCDLCDGIFTSITNSLHLRALSK